MDVNRIALSDKLVPYKHNLKIHILYILFMDRYMYTVYPYFVITTTIIIVCFPVIHRKDIAL